MAPDRGMASAESVPSYHTIVPSDNMAEEDDAAPDAYERQRRKLAMRGAQDTNFTVRGVVVGLLIGLIICFSNVYFGLQTGWISGMAMPSALIGFAIFKSVSRCLPYAFTPVENVLVQTVAGAVGTMPLSAGVVGVMPALNYLLTSEENGPVELSTSQLILWSVGICFIGVFVAVPLRREFLIREKLRFPSGTATALMIRVLHGEDDEQLPLENRRSNEEHEQLPLENRRSNEEDEDADGPVRDSQVSSEIDHSRSDKEELDWRKRITLLLVAFAGSAIYTLSSYFIPQLHGLPIFGLPLARNWEWSFNPSPAYVGQGIIMGPATSFHMLFGALLGWAVLSPLAKSNDWAPGPVNDWTTGSKGWIVWVSLAIMLADSIVSLGWLALRPTIDYGPLWVREITYAVQHRRFPNFFKSSAGPSYTPIRESDEPPTGTPTSPKPLTKSSTADETAEADAPADQLPPDKIVYPGLLAAIVLCIAAVHITFPNTIPFWATLLAIVFSLILSLMGVKALGETDLNPVSGISKLAQLAFAAILPSHPHTIIVNLVAGAISESAALQAGDLLQDMKAGHIIGASPRAQFYGQLIGSAFGSVAAALVYKLYASVYKIPSELFQVPTAYVWIFTARLVTGQGLPKMAAPFALVTGAVWAVLTGLRVYARDTKWHPWIPGGVAVAVGMYNVPNFTLARAVGGGIAAWWMKWKGRDEAPVIVLASGLILGEGLVSIVNLCLASLKVPHL